MDASVLADHAHSPLLSGEGMPAPAAADAPRKRLRWRTWGPSLPALIGNEPFGRLLGRVVRDVDTAAGAGVLLAAFLVTNVERMPHGLNDFLGARLTIKNFLLIVAFALAWRFLCIGMGLYDRRVVVTRQDETYRVIAVASIGSIVAGVFPIISQTDAFGFGAIVCFWLGVAGAMLLHRSLARVVLASRVSAPEEIVIVGTGPRAAKIYRELCADTERRAHVVGFVDTHDHACAEEIRARTLGPVDQLEAILMGRAVDQVLIALPVRSRYAEVQAAIRTCSRVGVPATYLADVFDHPLREPRFEEAAGRLSVVALPVAADDHRLIVKRIIDLLGAVLGLVVLAPLFVVLAVLIKLTSRGPVLFAQPRYGLRKRPFRMYKLRTMVADAEARQAELEARNEAAGPVFKITNDPRVTRIGRFLRRTSLDELPQLLNVLSGDMSLVGPRPLAVRDVHRFTEAALMRRFSVTPGMTGLWQISGRSDLPFDEWIRLDLEYIDRWSLRLDLGVLLRTIPAVIRCTGAR
jgi:exopolysaccharide biosynthesis polyprenyl glycosylphosphotransferase